MTRNPDSPSTEAYDRAWDFLTAQTTMVRQEAFSRRCRKAKPSMAVPQRRAARVPLRMMQPSCRVGRP